MTPTSYSLEVKDYLEEPCDVEEHGGPLAQGEAAIDATIELNHREQGGHVCQDIGAGMAPLYRSEVGVLVIDDQGGCWPHTEYLIPRAG